MCGASEGERNDDSVFALREAVCRVRRTARGGEPGDGVIVASLMIRWRTGRTEGGRQGEWELKRREWFACTGVCTGVVK